MQTLEQHARRCPSHSCMRLPWPRQHPHTKDTHFLTLYKTFSGLPAAHVHVCHPCCPASVHMHLTVRSPSD
jgi:hypothetical protein